MNALTEFRRATNATAQLLDRYHACSNLLQHDLDCFAGRGVDPIRGLGGATPEDLPLRRAAVVRAGPGRFIFADEMRSGGDPHVDAIIIGETDRTGTLIDLCAWDPVDGRTAVWLGRTALLGAASLYRPRLGEPLRVFRSLLGWLQNNRDGLVILDAFGAAFVEYDCTLSADDEEHRLELQRVLSRPGPTVVVAKRGRAAA